MSSIAIVGAGISGLAAAHSLQEASADVEVFEKSRGVSGRAASRTVDGVRFDHGANFFKLDEDEKVRKLVLEELPTDDLIEIPGDVWTFNSAGALTPGDPALNASSKYNYRSGISTLGKLLAAPVQSRIRFQLQIARMERDDEHWKLFSEAGESVGRFDQVLLTCPAPQMIQILKASSMDEALREAIVGVLGAARYHRQFTFVFAFDEKIPRPQGMHAALNVDAGHDIAWVSFEHDKEGHVPSGQSVVVVQMNPEWSDRHYEEGAELQVNAVIEKLSLLLCTELPKPLWWNRQRWGFAHPISGFDGEKLRFAEKSGFFVAGDGTFGKGRVHLALKSGLEAAERILSTAD